MAKKTTQGENIIDMTQDAYDELVKELEDRKNREREEIAKEISDARELGDLSENHAYTVAMEKKDMNENRISDLEELIKNVRIVKVSSSKNLVTIGSTVEIANIKTKAKKKVTLVGSEQTEAADPSSGKISIDSPIGKAVFNCRVGDIVEAELPTGKISFEILKLV